MSSLSSEEKRAVLSDLKPERERERERRKSKKSNKQKASKDTARKSKTGKTDRQRTPDRNDDSRKQVALVQVVMQGRKPST